MNEVKRLQILYKQIPAFECSKGCSDCCGIVPYSPSEFSRLPQHLRTWPLVDVKTHRCVFSSRAGCRIYAQRPFMCRIFGPVAGPSLLHCEKGLVLGEQLSASEGTWLAREYVAILKRAERYMTNEQRKHAFMLIRVSSEKINQVTHSNGPLLGYPVLGGVITDANTMPTGRK